MYDIQAWQWVFLMLLNTILKDAFYSCPTFLSNTFKGAVSQYSVMFCAFLREQKMAIVRANVADIRPWQLGQPREQLHRPSRIEQMPFSSMFSAALPCSRHYFSPRKVAAQNHRLSWHCRFNNSTEVLQVLAKLNVQGAKKVKEAFWMNLAKFMTWTTPAGTSHTASIPGTENKHEQQNSTTSSFDLQKPKWHFFSKSKPTIYESWTRRLTIRSRHHRPVQCIYVITDTCVFCPPIMDTTCFLLFCFKCFFLRCAKLF